MSIGESAFGGPAGGLRVAQPTPGAAEPAASPAPAPEPAPAPSPAPTPIAASSIETLLLRFRLVTPDQIAHAMSQQMASGKSVAEIVRENGWVSEEDLQKVLAHADPEAEPTPAVVPETRDEAVVALRTVAPAPEPAGEPAPEPVAAEPEPEPVAVAPEPEPEPELAPEPVAALPATPQPIGAPAPAPTPGPERAAPAVESGFTIEVLLHLVNGERLAVESFDSIAEARQRAEQLTRELTGGGAWPQVGGRLIRPESIVSIDLGVGC